VSDLVAFGETTLRLTPPGYERIETASEFEVRAAGAESNVAVAADRLGTTATWLSKLPDSPLGRRVVGELERHGVETEIVWTDEGRQGLSFFEHGTRPRGSNVVNDREDAAVTTAKPQEFDVDLIRDARLFFISGITPALSPTLRETVAAMLKAARKGGTTTAFDVNYRSKLWSPEEAKETLLRLFPGIDVLVIAARDARTVLGFEGDPRQLAHKLGSAYEFTTVVVTRSEQGALAWHDNVLHDHDVYETESVDPVGSGDAFTGAFLARRLAGADVPEALEYASAAAALVRTLPGNLAVLTVEEVEAVIAGDNELISR